LAIKTQRGLPENLLTGAKILNDENHEKQRLVIDKLYHSLKKNFNRDLMEENGSSFLWGQTP
jgi:hypothetical protein